MKLKKIKPLYTAIVTTMNKYDDVQYIKGTTIIDPKSTKKGVQEYQTVVAVGSSVREVKEGDIVCINPAHYAVKKYEDGSIKDGVQNMNQVTHYNFNIVELDGVEHLLLNERDIDFVVVEKGDS